MLFRGPDPHMPLPVAAPRETSQPGGRRQLIFESSQANRENIFEDGIQRRRHIFNVNEAKREANFERLQSIRKETAVQREYDQSSKFQSAQDSRQRMFQAVETSRVLGFHDAERKRAEAYQAAQATRDAKFHSIQEDLQDECFKSDIRRTSEFEEWASNLLRREEEILTEDLKDEKMRERMFARAVDMKRTKER
jgi:hypothetical protein